MLNKEQVDILRKKYTKKYIKVKKSLARLVKRNQKCMIKSWPTSSAVNFYITIKRYDTPYFYDYANYMSLLESELSKDSGYTVKIDTIRTGSSFAQDFDIMLRIVGKM